MLLLFQDVWYYKLVRCADFSTFNTSCVFWQASINAYILSGYVLAAIHQINKISDDSLFENKTRQALSIIIPNFTILGFFWDSVFDNSWTVKLPRIVNGILKLLSFEKSYNQMKFAFNILLAIFIARFGDWIPKNTDSTVTNYSLAKPLLIKYIEQP